MGDPGANAVFALPAEGGPPRIVRAGPPFLGIAGLALSGDALLVGDMADVRDALGNVTYGASAVFRIDLGPGAE